MLRTLKIISPLLLVLLVIGCSNDSDLGMNPTTTTDEPVGISLAAKAIPEGATITSAVLFMNVDYPTDQRIDVHRITAAWDENTITWNNFGMAYMPGVEGSFYADGMDWRSVDITALVQGWATGDYPNFGLALKQDSLPYSRTIMWSREGAYPPYLTVCYEIDGVSECENLAPIGDAYIYEIYPDSNFNVSIPEILFTGADMEVDPVTMAMIQFELSTTPPDDGGCTHTIGYWKNHIDGCCGGCGHGHRGRQEDMVSPLLPIWLGDAHGSKSIFVNSKYSAKIILSQHFGHPSNGIVKLYAQLLAAKLNIANGAGDAAVAGVIAQADAFLAGHARWSWWYMDRHTRNMILGWKDTLDDYNNGLIGPGPCDD